MSIIYDINRDYVAYYLLMLTESVGRYTVVACPATPLALLEMGQHDMPRKTVPFQVEQVLKELGHNIRKARVRRNISLAEMAGRLGVHRTLLSGVENGKPGTSIAAYAGMLWAMDLLPGLQAVADPESDSHGLALASREERERASSPRGLDNDF